MCVRRRSVPQHRQRKSQRATMEKHSSSSRRSRHQYDNLRSQSIAEREGDDCGREDRVWWYWWTQWNLKNLSSIFGASLLCGMNDHHHHHSSSHQNNHQIISARYDYQAQDANELSMRRADKFILLDDSKLWWLVKSVDNEDEVGYVPSNFMRRDRKNIFTKLIYGRRHKHTNSSHQHQQQQPHHNNRQLDHSRADAVCLNGQDIYAAAGNLLPCYAIVQHRYEAQKDDELTLTQGTRVTVLQKKNDGWWLLEACSRRGWFPSNHLSEHEPVATSTLLTNTAMAFPTRYRRADGAGSADDVIVFDCMRRSHRHQEVGFGGGGSVRSRGPTTFVRPLLAYEAKSDYELNVASGERLRLLDTPSVIASSSSSSSSLSARAPAANPTSPCDRRFHRKRSGAAAARSRSKNRSHCNNDDWLWVENDFGQKGFIPRSITMVDCSSIGFDDNHVTADNDDELDRCCGHRDQYSNPTGTTSKQPVRRHVGGIAAAECWNTIPREKKRFPRRRSSSSSSLASRSSGFANPYVVDPLKHYDWYYGLISRQLADTLLTTHGTAGDFLLRESTRRNTLVGGSHGKCAISANNRGYSVSVLSHNGRVRHFRIDQITAGCFSIGKRVFSSLKDLVNYYKAHPIFDDAECMTKLHLIRPLKCPSSGKLIGSSPFADPNNQQQQFKLSIANQTTTTTGELGGTEIAQLPDM